MQGIIFEDFEHASAAVLSFLRERFGFDLWMVTRTEGDDWIVLQREDHGYGIAPGTVLRWADSFCSQMVQGRGPLIAPDSNRVMAYAEAPIARQVHIGAYAGYPLRRADGSLFGTLCGIHPAPQPDALIQEEPLFILLGSLLSSLLDAELRAHEEGRRADRARAESMTDFMTELYNRRGWEQLLAAEEDRCRRYGHPAVALVVDLDGLKRVNDQHGHAAGDALIRRTAEALRRAIRAGDVLARLGGDEFGILGIECSRSEGEALLARVRQILHELALPASVGLAPREPAQGLLAAWKSADQAMYADKRARQSAS
ncbi:sensor domain-containing diguanylate cyclase [Chitinimonas taiwanensis]|uniref:sensor domain-containing diguanylate cyclase n=1 Tax=Chitinimonas taiwanensis TaxID=240412 RepID=UPI0035B16C17